MKVLDITKAFSTNTQSVNRFFGEAALGFYIPLYQREYSWDQENIEQLMDDLIQGTDSLINDASLSRDSDDIRFLGTIIKVTETNPQLTISPQDPRAFPTRIDSIIDGQQRISTIALLGTLLYRELRGLRDEFPAEGQYEPVVSEIIPSKLQIIRDLFSFDLRRGVPTLKPVIIRGGIDQWSFDDTSGDGYKSDVAHYIASVLRAIHSDTSFRLPARTNLVGKNLNFMESRLGQIKNAHVRQDESSLRFPSAGQILEQLDESLIWDYPRQDLCNIVYDTTDTSNERNALCSLVQVLAFCHYLLDRCCFTVIDPISRDWAFDMFQSLNATGTPLTAIETFKPMVVNTAMMTDEGYQGSKFEQYFSKVDALVARETSAARRSKLTDEFLNLWAYAHSGEKLSRRFSMQRKWLEQSFEECKTTASRRDFMKRMGQTATYLSEILDFDYREANAFDLRGLDTPSRELATFCTLYLHDAGHKMAHTVLSRFYALVPENEPEGPHNFLGASKAVAAFYTLWRAALPNTGLDEVYRSILRGNEDLGISRLAWIGDPAEFSLENLKRHLRRALDRKGIGTQEQWLSNIQQNLRADLAKPVCRFALFVTAQDTVADSKHPGLMSVAREGVTRSYMTPEMWRGMDLRTIEHIAPQSNTGRWDEQLYQDGEYELIGNLTLLPHQVNTSAGNRDWSAKWIYYAHLAESDPDRLTELAEYASEHSVELNETTIQLLQNSTFNDHIQPLVDVGFDGGWNLDIVRARTQRIATILWDRLIKWLE